MKYVLLIIGGFLLNDLSKTAAMLINDNYIIKPCNHLMNPEYAKCTYSDKNKVIILITDVLDYNIFLHNFYYGK